MQDYTHTIEMFSERLFDGAIGVPTLFERIDVRSHVSLMPVFRGADLLTIPAPRDLAELVGALATGLADEETPIRREPYEALDRAAVDQALEAFREHGIPDLQVVYL